jgi:DAACS family dicarboxylate/amino acid:cation (Na+ or H+) symporter
MPLWGRILISLGLGVITGLVLGPEAAVLKPLGTVFMNLIEMVIVLLVLSSMAVGITGLHDPKQLGRVGGKTLSFYFVTSLIAALVGLTLAYAAGLGVGVEQPITHINEAHHAPSLMSILMDIVPTNPIAALVSGNVLQIIVFSIFLGLSINLAGEKGRPFKELLGSLADTMYSLTSIVMEFSPLGVFAFMAVAAGSFGVKVLLQLAWFLTVYYVACMFQLIVVFGGLLLFVGRLHPIPFFRGMWDAIVVAFSTASSSATLPVSMHCIQENLGVSKSISSFVLPLGSTVNMAGSAIFQVMSAVFISHAYGIELGLVQLSTIVVTSIFSAIGAAGIPGSGFLMLSAVLHGAGLPIEGLALLAGIDRLREMVSSVVNIMGDAVVAVTIAKQEGELDESLYYQAEEVLLEGSEA